MATGPQSSAPEADRAVLEAGGLHGRLLPGEGRVGDSGDGARDQGPRLASSLVTPGPSQKGARSRTPPIGRQKVPAAPGIVDGCFSRPTEGRRSLAFGRGWLTRSRMRVALPRPKLFSKLRRRATRRPTGRPGTQRSR
eukprot:652076-Alexandrium_andersonii.AAC.1